MSKMFGLMVLALAASAGQVGAQREPAVKAEMIQLAEVAGRIATLKSEAGSDPWDHEVEAIMVAAFDKNKSNDIDTEGELAAVPCDVWKALDGALRSADKSNSLIGTYGFAKGEYDGDSLGIVDKMRKAALARIEGCGVTVDK